MSWWVTGAMAVGSAVSGIYSADAKRRSGKAQADEYARVAKETMLTESFNRRQRNQESRQTDLSTLEQGARALSEVATQGQKEQAAMMAESSGSGAIVSSGSTLDVMMSEAVNNTVRQLSVVDATKDAIESNQRNLKNTNESNYRNAKLGQSQLNRKENMTNKASKDAYTADIFSSIVQGGAYASKGYSPTSKRKQFGTGDQHGRG
jgi:hypothetical protein